MSVSCKVGDWIKFKTSSGKPSLSILEVREVRGSDRPWVITAHGSYRLEDIIESRPPPGEHHE